MSVMAGIGFCFPARAFRRCAIPALQARVPRHAVSGVWARSVSLQKELARARPRYAPGLMLVLRYMEWDVALYRAAREAGVSASDAGRLIEEVNWAAFSPATQLSFALSRLRSAKLFVRVEWIIDLMFRLIFSAPFRRRTYPTTGEIAFDVVACPLANYFNERGVPELTRFAACSLDHGMARVWGMTLQRTQTIADGYPLCDFRFRRAL